MNQEFKFKTAQNSKNLKLFCSSSFEFQTRNYITCFGHICNHPCSRDSSGDLALSSQLDQ